MTPLKKLTGHYAEAARLLESRGVRPRSVVVLGSGQRLGDEFGLTEEIPYAQVPGIPRPTVEGHGGAFYYSPELEALVCAGRFHAYEGYSLGVIAFAPALAALLGAEVLLLCNSAGGLNPDIAPGELMLIEDHLNLISPGLVALDQWMDADSEPRDRPFRIYGYPWPTSGGLHRGTYVSLPGPTYETPAEATFLRGAGGDAVGMSTAWEALTAKLLDLTVGGVSLVTNRAGGISSHEEVLAAAEKGKKALGELLLAALTGGGDGQD